MYRMNIRRSTEDVSVLGEKRKYCVFVFEVEDEQVVVLELWKVLGGKEK